VPIGVAVGLGSAISFVVNAGSGDGNLSSRGKTDVTLDELDEDVDGEGDAITEGSKEEVDDDLGLNRDSPESFCTDGNVSIDVSNPKSPSDSVEEPAISRREDEFKL
jgi:hypothetical protein